MASGARRKLITVASLQRDFLLQQQKTLAVEKINHYN
jgi:hypothetical protein